MSGLREESREGKNEAQACVQDPEHWPLGSFPLTLGVEGSWPGCDGASSVPGPLSFQIVWFDSLADRRQVSPK